MIEDRFFKLIEHSISREKKIEKSECSAFKIDDKDGLAEHLGFSKLSKVDYFSKNGDKIQLIELSDLENDINKCKCNLAEEISKAEKKKGNKLNTREERPIRKQAWSLITNELQRKWSGSIAIIERLYRKNQIVDNDPDYQLLIVCKNKTDIRMLDILKVQLQGMMKIVNVCNTKNLSVLLISSDE